MHYRTEVTVFVCFLVFACTNGQYHGKAIGTFPNSAQHSVAGTVYAVDDDTIRLVGFSYDGTAPDAFVWAGETNAPDGSGFIIGSNTPLGRYVNQEVEFDLPAGKDVSSLTWISIWCRQFGINFGHVAVPANFAPPAEQNLGEMGYTPRQHGVHATSVVIVNTRQFRFENLDYDGAGPDAFFWAGTGSTPTSGGHIVPDETGGTDVLGGYSGSTVTITLPGSETVFDIGHIGLWCRQFTADFGHIDIPAADQLNVPPGPPPSTPPPPPPPTTPPPTTTTPTPIATTTQDPSEVFPNCETLVVGEAQVSWRIEGNDVVIQLRSVGDAREKYFAFGVSGSQTRNMMLGGDVVVTFVDSGGQANAVDYHLSALSQCSPQNGQGACPDEIASNQANNDATLIDSLVADGVTTITYRRPLAAQDATYDKEIVVDQALYVIWSRGSLNSDGYVSYHFNQRVSGDADLQIDFGRASSTCPSLFPQVNPTEPQEIVGWDIPMIIERENATFVAEMGLAGGQVGYESTTGRVGWGIAWFINELLIPELVVERGQTYTFLVSGGNDSSISANYHPFYITDDENGGYDQLPNVDQQNVTIFAGPEEGPLCQWRATQNTLDPGTYETFEEYRATLTKVCEPGEPAELVWTVAEDTPDIVYYQCYTHRFLGWKIHVLDPGEVGPTESAIEPTREDVEQPMMTTPAFGDASTISMSVSLIAFLLIIYATLY